MSRLPLLLSASVLVILAGRTTAAPEVGPAAFAEYPVREHFTGTTALPRFRTKQDREFRTTLSRAARQRPNFAGHYVLTTIGCGASCVMTAVLDAKTGEVTWLPFTLCCWEPNQEPVMFRLDSDLLILRGRKNEQEFGTWALRFSQGKFEPVSK